ncbi:hypothetical protein BY458DRAFT_513172 [Sporodiniella umbellata]|nr:hypothetical protein BY458DRAFT_513172 [Sporodiniella umbellata]
MLSNQKDNSLSTQTDRLKNYHTMAEEEMFPEESFRFQQMDVPSLLEQTPPHTFDLPDFEVAHRVFYATLDKFTKQNGPDARRRSYSFLQNWHLHRIFSKSQQTLLQLQPVKPSVILCGDDFMLTPPSLSQQESRCYFDSHSEQRWNVGDQRLLSESDPAIEGRVVSALDVSSERRPLAPALYAEPKHFDLPENGVYNNDPLDTTYPLHTFDTPSHHSPETDRFEHDPFDLFDEVYSATTSDDTEQSMLFSCSDSSADSDSEEETDYKRRSFYAEDEYERSSYDDLMNLYDTTIEIEPIPPTESQPATRSLSYLSEGSYLTGHSVGSYQSLADIITCQTEETSPSSSSWLKQSSRLLDKAKAWVDHRSGEETLLSRFIVYVVSIWDTLSSFVFKPSPSEVAMFA